MHNPVAHRPVIQDASTVLQGRAFQGHSAALPGYPIVLPGDATLVLHGDGSWSVVTAAAPSIGRTFMLMGA